MGKSKSQILRMIKRAEARGETYEPPAEFYAKEQANNSEELATEEVKADSGTTSKGRKSKKESDIKVETAEKLLLELEEIENNQELRSKDRRSAKRKAEAIAAQEAGCPAEELLAWYNTRKETKKRKKDNADVAAPNPYIVFVGQLSYTTTKAQIFEHFRTALGEELEVTPETLRVRLLTDSKTKASRGMAFVEVSNPELLYACLKMHQTFLDGRRINVERSAGGKRNSEKRKRKLEELRKEQVEHFDTVVESIFDEQYESGAIKKGELDEGVVKLCKRHTAIIVTAALEKYVESNGRDMDNPSAYLTFLLGKLASEGIHEKQDTEPTSWKSPSRSPSDQKRSAGPNKKKTESVLGSSGVDMSISTPSTDTEPRMSSIFPSYGRGRGRGKPSAT